MNFSAAALTFEFLVSFAADMMKHIASRISEASVPTPGAQLAAIER